MNLTTKTLLAAMAATLLGALCTPGTASATPVRWTHWNSAVAGANGHALGQIPVAGGGSIAVSYTGQLAFWDSPGSTSYWTDQGSTYTSPRIDNGPGNSGMLALSRQGTRTLSFSQAVDDLIFAFIGLNSVGYEFDQDFIIESSGGGHLGSGSFNKEVLPNGKFRLTGTGEPHGLIRFDQPLSSISWTSLADETWNGFTVGSYGAAAPVPEPATWALMGLGLLGIVWLRRQRTGSSGQA